MKITIVARSGNWGGDLKALRTIEAGLLMLGHEVKFIESLNNLPMDTLAKMDHVFLSNTCHYHEQEREQLVAAGVRYSIVTFHEDFLKYWDPCMGFFNYIQQHMQDASDGHFKFDLERLWEHPDIVRYYTSGLNRVNVLNYETLRDAHVCVANSKSEALTLKRDCAPCNAQAVYWAPGFAEGWHLDGNEEFLKLTGLKKNDYMLQVGRLETRKNQLATIMASKDIDMPLVFIATRSDQEAYEKAVAFLSKKYRKHKTIIVSETYGNQDMGHVKMIQMPGGVKLSETMLKSAYENCAVNVHPAFYELPGYTYLEALKMKKPCVASSWCSISDYLREFSLNKRDESYSHMVKYSDPHDLPGIRDNILYHLNNPHHIPDNFEHPVLKRTARDVAEDLCKIL
jgi:glycosyltransferase involved in cell wall biosynthesis